MTIREARKLANYWIEILGIPEWQEKLKIRWGTKAEMGDNAGLNYFLAEDLRSEIKLARDLEEDEFEPTIVHELLHLVVDGHKDLTEITGPNYNRLHERALNRLAETLIALDKATKNGN